MYTEQFFLNRINYSIFSFWIIKYKLQNLQNITNIIHLTYLICTCVNVNWKIQFRMRTTSHFRNNNWKLTELRTVKSYPHVSYRICPTVQTLAISLFLFLLFISLWVTGKYKLYVDISSLVDISRRKEAWHKRKTHESVVFIFFMFI